jgi:hypothetical protein
MLIYCPRQTSSLQLLFPNVSLLVLLIKTEDAFMEGGVPLLATIEDIGLFLGLIFTASVGLPTMIEGKEIDSKTGGIMAFQSGLMSGASYVNSSTTQPFNMFNFKAIDNSLVQILR